MQVSKLKKCTTCATLLSIYNQVDCSIYQLIKNKWTNHAYAVDLYFDSVQYHILLRLKRIVGKRLYNQDYPAGCFDSQDIIALATKLTYNPNKCLPCPCLDWSTFIPSSSTSSTSTSTLVPVTLCYNYSVFKTIQDEEATLIYTTCDGVELTIEISANETEGVVVCAEEDQLSGENIFYVQGGLCE